MIGEILTAAFAVATGGYLWARHKHYNDPIKRKWAKMISVDKVSISKEAAEKQYRDLFAWRGNTNAVPETAKEFNESKYRAIQDLKNDEHMVYNDAELQRRKRADRERLEIELKKYVAETKK